MLFIVLPSLKAQDDNSFNVYRKQKQEQYRKYRTAKGNEDRKYRERKRKEFEEYRYKKNQEFANRLGKTWVFVPMEEAVPAPIKPNPFVQLRNLRLICLHLYHRK